MSEIKTKQIGFWVSLEDHEILRKLAFENRLSLGGFVRLSVLKEIKKYKKKED